MGDRYSCASEDALHVRGIRTVVSVNCPLRKPKKHPLHNYEFSVVSEIEARLFDEVTSIIDAKLRWHSVLVCCPTGLNFSPLMIMAFLAKCRGWKYEKTYYYLKERRNLINPDVKLRRQLIQYLEEQTARKASVEDLKLFSTKIVELVESQKYLQESPTAVHHEDLSDLGAETPQFRDSPKQFRSSMKKGSFRKPSIKGAERMQTLGEEEDSLNCSFHLEEVDGPLQYFAGLETDRDGEEVRSPQFCETFRKRHRRYRNNRNKSM